MEISEGRCNKDMKIIISLQQEIFRERDIKRYLDKDHKANLPNSTLTLSNPFQNLIEILPNVVEYKCNQKTIEDECFN